jgi:CheY-like chemotaxis protein
VTAPFDSLPLAQGRPTILVVENRIDTQNALIALLNGEGYTVVTVENGQQAIDVLASGLRPELFILDLGSPRVSGADVLRFLQSEPDFRATPVVVINGWRREDADVIADGVLEQPGRYGRLLTLVRRLLDGNAPAVAD